jgi:phage/plasmid-like protein (TIGR03299 family)
MPHEIEINEKTGKAAIFTVGERPWHGLGQILQAPPSIEEGIKLAGLDWTVGLKPLFTAEGEKIEDAQLCYRQSDNKHLGTVGPTYKPLQNVDAFKFFNPFLEQGLATLESAGSLRDGKRVWVLAKIKEAVAEVVNGDPVEAYVLLSNSHDATLAARVGFTPTRVVCANTLAMAHNTRDLSNKLIRVRHTGKILENLEKIREVMNLATREFQATIEQYRELASRQISEKDLEKYVRIVFNTNKNAITEADLTGTRVLPKVKELFETGKGQALPGVKGTYWAAYNAITDFLTHHRGKDAEIRLDANWFGNNAELNRKALETAKQMFLGKEAA